jgi:hypothetical protein
MRRATASRLTSCAAPGSSRLAVKAMDASSDRDMQVRSRETPTRVATPGLSWNNFALSVMRSVRGFGASYAEASGHLGAVFGSQLRAEALLHSCSGPAHVSVLTLNCSTRVSGRTHASLESVHCEHTTKRTRGEPTMRATTPAFTNAAQGAALTAAGQCIARHSRPASTGCPAQPASGRTRLTGRRINVRGSRRPHAALLYSMACLNAKALRPRLIPRPSC